MAADTSFTHLGTPPFPTPAELMGRRESEGRRDCPCGWWPGVHVPLAVLLVQLYPAFRVAPNVKAGRDALAQGPSEVPSSPAQIPPYPGFRIPPFPAQDRSTQGPCTLHVSAFAPLTWWFAAGELLW